MLSGFKFIRLSREPHHNPANDPWNYPIVSRLNLVQWSRQMKQAFTLQCTVDMMDQMLAYSQGSV